MAVLVVIPCRCTIKIVSPNNPYICKKCNLAINYEEGI